MPWTATVVEDKIRQVQTAWENLAPTQSFGGMTLEQFHARVKPSVDARATIANLENQLRATYNSREASDREAAEGIILVVNGVRADPQQGEDSALYEAMGYVRKSERRSGMRSGRRAKALLAKAA
jgi:hypothetical protein